MFSFHHSLLFDIGINFVGIFLGIGYAILSFIVVVMLEARVMLGYFHLVYEYPFPIQKRIKYSLIINTVSTIVGLPLAFYFLWYIFDYSSAEYFRWLLFSFVLTVVVEFIIIIFLIKPKPSIKEAMSFSVLSNIASYAVILVLSFVFPFLEYFIHSLIYRH